MKRELAMFGGILLIAAVAFGLYERGGPPAPPAQPAFALSTTAITLPPDTATLSPGPHADVVTANCTACHSATMLTTQPALSRAQWQASVEKMRTVYKAPIADADVPAIVAYLEAMSARQAAIAR